MAARVDLSDDIASSAVKTWIANMMVVDQNPRAVSFELPAPERLDPMSPKYDPKMTVRAAPVLFGRVASICAEAVTKPSGEEPYNAFHATLPTDREIALVTMWTEEASSEGLADSWLQDADAWRELVAAMHKCGCTRHWKLPAEPRSEGQRNGPSARTDDEHRMNQDGLADTEPVCVTRAGDAANAAAEPNKRISDLTMVTSHGP